MARSFQFLSRRQRDEVNARPDVILALAAATALELRSWPEYDAAMRTFHLLRNQYAACYPDEDSS